MAHSKRNTSLAFFTSYERSLLRSTWGSQSATLSRDSFLPFGSCLLCLLPSRDPVACIGAPAHPKQKYDLCHIFCRECAISNLLAQRKEIKRLEKKMEREREEAAEADARADDEARTRAVEDFEKVQIGLEAKLGKGDASGWQRKITSLADGKVTVEESAISSPADASSGDQPKKRKFQLDEEELIRMAHDERNKVKKTLNIEKDAAARSSLPSFWIPALTPTSSSATADKGAQSRKLQPLCPGSAATSSTSHSYSLKTLVSVKFSIDESHDRSFAKQSVSEPVRSCPACQKSLSNASRAMLAKPCGHVICGSCVDKFMSGTLRDDYENTSEQVTCYVCSEDLGINDGKKDRKNAKDKDREKILPGLVQISSDGTGFAGGGGKTVVEKQGVAFQC